MRDYVDIGCQFLQAVATAVGVFALLGALSIALGCSSVRDAAALTAHGAVVSIDLLTDELDAKYEQALDDCLDADDPIVCAAAADTHFTPLYQLREDAVRKHAALIAAIELYDAGGQVDIAKVERLAAELAYTLQQLSQLMGHDL